MPPRTARKKRTTKKAKVVEVVSSDDHEEDEPKEEEEEEEEKVSNIIEDDSDYKEKTKRKRKKKNDNSEKPKKKKASSSNIETEEIADDKTNDDIEQDYMMMDVKEEEVEVSLDSLKFDNEFTMQAVSHVKDSVAFLDSIELNYPSLPAAERQGIITILKHLQNKVAKLGDLCKSAELLLFRGKNHDMSEYGLLNTIQLPEIWSTVFSYLDFSDFLKASQVCKTWQTASLHPCALSCFNLDFNVDYSNFHYVEIYKKYIAWRLENIRTVWEIPMRLIKWFANSDIVFPNAKYRDVKFKVAWEETNETNDPDVAKVFPKNSKSIFEPEFISLWGFFDFRSSSKNTIPAGTNIAKLFDKQVEFEDPDSIEELVILKVDETKLPQFNNLQRLDLSLMLRMRETDDMSYCFTSSKLTKLSVTYSVHFSEMKQIVQNLEYIKSLKVVDCPVYKRSCNIVSELAKFKNLTELEIETLNESDLVAFPSTIRKLKIGKITEKNSKIFPLLVNIEELHTTEQVLSHINLIRLPNLKTLLVYNNSSNHNKQITIESSTLENICLLTYNSITIKCPNLYDLRLGPGLKGGSDSVYIKSNQLTNFVLERDVQMLSIQGPNFVANGKILEKVKNIVDLECPLIDRAYVNSLSSINQGDSFRTLLTKQIKSLTISVSYFDLFNTKTEIQHLSITNWKSNPTISAAKLNTYKQNIENYKTVEITNCSVDVVKLLNSIFKESTNLESLKIQDTTYDTEYMDSLADPLCYPNMNSLSLCNISSLKPQYGTAFLQKCDKRLLLTKIELQYRSSYKKKYHTYIPMHCTSYIGQLSDLSNGKEIPNLTHLTILQGGMPKIDFSAFKYFPNLKFLHFAQISYLESSLPGAEKILDHCKKLETVISIFSIPKEFHEKKEITVVENV